MVSVMISTNVLSTEEHVLMVVRISMVDSLVAVKMAHSKLEIGNSGAPVDSGQTKMPVYP